MRELGRVRGDAPGPTLIVVGGMHGNEPEGVAAAEKMLQAAQARGLGAGEVIALEANTAALAAGRRYLVRDLNRVWSDDSLAAARARLARGERDAETHSQVALADVLDAAIAGARGSIYALDLHTSSSAGIPFTILGSSAADRGFAARFPLPGIVGLQERLDGVLTRHLVHRGCVALAIVGGRSGTASAAQSLADVALLALVATGLASPPDAPEAAARLAAIRGCLPALIEVVHRHEVTPARRFVMEPGLLNIQRVAENTLLAKEQGEDVRAPFDGYVLLPLYQPQGQDGFFFGRAAS